MRPSLLRAVLVLLAGILAADNAAGKQGTDAAASSAAAATDAPAPPLAAKAFSIIQAVTMRCVGANGVFDFVEEGGDDLLFTIPIGFDGRGYKLPIQPPMDMRCRFIVPREGQLNEVEF